MSLNNIKKLQSQRGFTLVELLIVIVIIAILAAITIVAYNGITNRAHSSASQQAAQNVVNKVEAYNAETGAYPTTFAALTGATSDKSYYMPSTAVTFTGGSGTTAGPITATPTNNKDNNIGFATCGSAVGVKVAYWKYDGTAAQQYMTAGDTSGTCTWTAS